MPGGFPAARVTDMHTCPMCMGAPFPVLPPGAPTVLIGKMPAARMTDLCACIIPALVPVPSIDMIVFGSPTVLIMGLPAARMMDPTVKGGMILPPCCPTVLIGVAGAPTITPPGVPDAPGMPAVAGMVPPGSQSAVPPSAEGERKVGPWPVTSAPTAGGNVTRTVGPNITVTGPKNFVDKVQADLGNLYATNSGKALLDSLQASPHKTEIVPSRTNLNSCGFPQGDARFAKADGTPGAGMPALIFYNPDSTSIGPEDWAQRPPEVGLMHELVHADDAGKGLMAPGTTDGVKNLELQAIGLPPYEAKFPTENSLRAEMPGLGKRPVYD